MRKSKFRAWDKEDKRMIVHEQEFIPLKVTNIGVFKLDPCSKEDRWILQDKDRFELMQDTGFRGRNDKGIYEGDIVKEDTNIAIVRFGKYQANNNHIYINEVAYGFYLEYLSHKGVIDHAEKLDYYEVIGNIYENKNLI